MKQDNHNEWADLLWELERSLLYDKQDCTPEEKIIYSGIVLWIEEELMIRNLKYPHLKPDMAENR